MMRKKSKPVDELTIEDLKQFPIWDWAIGSEGEEEQDETWVQPAETTNFTAVLNGSIVLGEATINDKELSPLMCSLDIEGQEAFISSIVLYDKERADYYAIEDKIKQLDFPVAITIHLQINGVLRKLHFSATKVDLYKNKVSTDLF
ncbi:hypothetical protein [Planococcus sp. 107-1]|uniref:hypothetical protein n=1 Tax=Planococcus sp. 107-1 TaxID=2908840 RepID=UPI001F1634AA|nr:hypothetical protein [Planococcus sp. 107-1]UJF28451.1 hypothetical protein L0M13_09155 [Planococcus sp. 107-1]